MTRMRVRGRIRRALGRDRAPGVEAPPPLIDQFRELTGMRAPGGPPPESAVRVGIASFGAGPGHLVVDTLLAHALELRGAACQLLVCDVPELPGCDERLLESDDNRRCATCIDPKRPFLDAAGVDWVALSALLPDGTATLAAVEAAVAACPDDELTRFEFEGWPVGEWLGSSVASFLRSDSHGMRPEVVEARRRYLVSGVVALVAARRWLDEWQPDVLMVISGRHVLWRAAREVAEARGVKVVCREMFNESFDCHIYAVNSSCEDPALPEAWAAARSTPLTPEQDARVDEFLRGLPRFARQTEADPELETRQSAIRAQLGLEAGRPLLVLFTNVAWDLFVAERDAGFDGQMEWIAATLEFARRHPEIDLVVRAHPAEIVPKFRTRGRIADQIVEELSPLSPNTRLVGPESDISSDTLRSMATLNVVYCASVGLEAVIAGQPVLICGRPYYSGKGFTTDVGSRDEYERLLAEHLLCHPLRSDPEHALLARRFTYLIRFRYAIPMGLTNDDVTDLRLTIHGIDALAPGASAALDTVCDGILHRHEILLPA